MQYIKSFKPEALDDPRLNRIMQNLDRELQKIARALAVPSVVLLAVPVRILELATSNPAATWADLDLSGSVPIGSTAAYLRISVADGIVGRNVGLRKNGETPTYYFNVLTQIADITNSATSIVGVDANSIVEWGASHADLDHISIDIFGYFNG